MNLWLSNAEGLTQGGPCSTVALDRYSSLQIEPKPKILNTSDLLQHKAKYEKIHTSQKLIDPGNRPMVMAQPSYQGTDSFLSPFHHPLIQTLHYPEYEERVLLLKLYLRIKKTFLTVFLDPIFPLILLARNGPHFLWRHVEWHDLNAFMSGP